MTISEREFEAIAYAIRRRHETVYTHVSEHETITRVAKAIAFSLRELNRNFDVDRFMRACEPADIDQQAKEDNL